MKIMIAVLLVICLFVAGAASENGDIYIAIGSIARVFGADQVAVYAEPSDAYDPLFMLDNKSEVTVIGENVDEGYTLINFHGQSGYVKSEFIDMMDSIGGLSVYSGLSDETKLQLNRFVTIFTETDLAYYSQGVFDVNDTSDEILNRCALDYLMLEGGAETEYGDFEYGNLKVAETPDIAEFVRSTFGVTPSTPEAAYLTYVDGTYYTEITDDLFRGDFAIVTNVIDMQDGTYELRFSAFGMGYGWDEASLEMSEDEARAAYGDFPGAAGYALISAEDINDAGTYKLIKLVTAR